MKEIDSLIKSQGKSFESYIESIKNLNSELERQIGICEKKSKKLDEELEKVESVRKETLKRKENIAILQRQLESKESSLESNKALLDEKIKKADRKQIELQNQAKMQEKQKEDLDRFNKELIFKQRENEMDARKLELYRNKIDKLIEDKQIIRDLENMK